MSRLHRLLCAAAASLAILITASTAIAQEASYPGEPGGPERPAAAADITVRRRRVRVHRLPTSVPAGTTFDNLGAELHQLLVVQKNEGITETWDELMALPDRTPTARSPSSACSSPDPARQASTRS